VRLVEVFALGFAEAAFALVVVDLGPGFAFVVAFFGAAAFVFLEAAVLAVFVVAFVAVFCIRSYQWDVMAKILKATHLGSCLLRNSFGWLCFSSWLGFGCIFLMELDSARRAWE